MNAREARCPICGLDAEKSGVPGKMDFRISCRRCKLFDIDRRAEVNLANGDRAPNAAILSGISRHQHETNPQEGLPRLVWVDVNGNRDGRYEFQGISSDRLPASEKRNSLMQHFGKVTDWTPGDDVYLFLPDDLSLAYARSHGELDTYLSELANEGLIRTEETSETTRHVVLTSKGADYAIEPQPSRDAPQTLEKLNVEIHGDKVDSGAFGQVYVGTQQPIGRTVAVKIIQPHTKPGAVEHAIALAKVNHPNVVIVHGVGTLKDPITGLLVEAVMMEWIEGRKLFEVWSAFEKQEAYRLAIQIIEAVVAMHAAGVCHHDLHAGNIMVRDGRVTIIDLHYTDSARFSRVGETDKSRLIDGDRTAVAVLLRNLFWNALGPDLPPEFDTKLHAAASLAELQDVVTELFGSPNTDPKSGKSDEQLLLPPGFAIIDADVLDAACAQVIKGNRFATAVSVPSIVEFLGKSSDHSSDAIFRSIRLLAELDAFSEIASDHPRFVMVTHRGFEWHLQRKLPTYLQDVSRIKVALVRGKARSGADLSVELDISLPIVEHVLVAMFQSSLIDISQYNTGIHVQKVSERLVRECERC